MATKLLTYSSSKIEKSNHSGAGYLTAMKNKAFLGRNRAPARSQGKALADEPIRWRRSEDMGVYHGLIVIGNGAWGAGESLTEAWNAYRKHNGPMSGNCTIFMGERLRLDEMGRLYAATGTRPEQLYNGRVSRAPKGVLLDYQRYERVKIQPGFTPADGPIRGGR